jgi:hypothetical protein
MVWRATGSPQKRFSWLRSIGYAASCMPTSENTNSRTFVNKALAASGLATHAIVIYVTHRVREKESLSLLREE